MTYDLSVIAPCYNEAGNLHELVRRLQATFDSISLRGQIVLINDASQDGTGEAIDQLASDHDNVVGVHHETNRGMVGGWKSGLAAAKGENICLIDADLQYRPEDVAKLYQQLQSNEEEIVQGFRSTKDRKTDSRLILSKGLNFLLNTLFGMRLRDNKSGFIVCRKEVLANVLQYQCRYRYFQSLIAVAANSWGYKIREVEIIFDERKSGESFISRFPLKVVMGCMLDLIPAFWEFRICNKQSQVKRGT